MAKQVLTDVVVQLNGTIISQNVNSVEITKTSDAIETTSFDATAQGFRTYVGGLKQASLTLNLHNDYASTALDGVINSLFNTIATVTVFPAGTLAGTAAGTSNPKYTLTALVNNTQPIAGAVGDLAVQSLTWQVTGPVVRSTS